MSCKLPLLAWIALAAPLLLSSTPALAGGDKGKDDPAKTDGARKDEDGKKDDAKKDDKAGTPDDKYDPFEDPNKTYRFIGLRYRDAIAPRFMMNWFADGGRNVNVPMVGPEFITRKDHLEIAISLMYADYGMDPTLFKSKGDTDESYELVQSGLKLGYLMIDLMYEVPIEKRGEKTGRFAFLIGGGVGVAGVFGSLYRSQAYPNTPGADPGSPSQWTACQNPMQGPGAYCSNPTNNHYAGPGGNVAAGYSEPSWANGGSKPLIFPWIALPQIGFRYKPIKQFQMKVDGGFSTSGFFFGFSGSYGIPSSS